MFKVGDKIYINKKYNFLPWYTENLFTIIEMIKDDKIVKLDGRLPLNNTTYINVEFIVHNYIYDRKEKLQKINETR